MLVRIHVCVCVWVGGGGGNNWVHALTACVRVCDQCLNSLILHMCVENRVRVQPCIITMCVCVCGKGQDQVFALINVTSDCMWEGETECCVCNRSPSDCNHYYFMCVWRKGDLITCTHEY